MAKVILLCLNKHRFGQSVVLPFIGETKVPENGELEVEESVARHIVDGGASNWTIQGEDTEEEVEVVEKTKRMSKSDLKAKKKADAEAKKLAEEQEEEAEEEEEDELGDLEKLEIKELLELAVSLGHDAASYEKFKNSKKLMINFLKKN